MATIGGACGMLAEQLDEQSGRARELQHIGGGALAKTSVLAIIGKVGQRPKVGENSQAVGCLIET